MKLKVIVKNSVEALDLKAQVQEVCGLNQFLWRYTPAVSDWLSQELAPATVEFEFKDPKWETYFELKWSR